jgi:hypothetical protein
MRVVGKIQRRGPKALSIIAEDLSALDLKDHFIQVLDLPTAS